MDVTKDLPQVLPLFPLTGVLLLPGMQLPLHIFEPRYRAMVRHALKGAALIGMVQPLAPRQDNQPDPEAPPESPELYAVGCAGKILHSQQTEDGRYLITLLGVSRFRIAEELPPLEGFRRAGVDYLDRSSAEDLAHHGTGVSEEDLLRDVNAYLGTRGIALAPEPLKGLPLGPLVRALCMLLPFAPSEKQALLESPDDSTRLITLRSLLTLGELALGEDRYTPPSRN
ncbi:MAG: LON peptidase substrate-binding domain-containing protein [Deltaproteobacteria bacterium]|nr:LON peptidase substrate-binding domain-containing protein [Deltaproteobacteria bacterium]